jgi:hypothetical protein
VGVDHLLQNTPVPDNRPQIVQFAFDLAAHAAGPWKVRGLKKKARDNSGPEPFAARANALV